MDRFLINGPVMREKLGHISGCVRLEDCYLEAWTELVRTRKVFV